MGERISVELDEDAAAELQRLAHADDAEPEQYAASLLTQLMRGRTLGADEATQLLRGIPGALEDAHAGSAQARRGKVTPLDSV